jgi:hypothetical protein
MHLPSIRRQMHEINALEQAGTVVHIARFLAIDDLAACMSGY